MKLAMLPEVMLPTLITRSGALLELFSMPLTKILGLSSVTSDSRWERLRGSRLAVAPESTVKL